MTPPQSPGAGIDPFTAKGIWRYVCEAMEALLEIDAGETPSHVRAQINEIHYTLAHARDLLADD